MGEEPRGERPGEGFDDPLAGGRPPLIGVAVTLGGIVLLGGLVLLIDPLRGGAESVVSGDTEALRAELRDLELTGALVVLALALLHAVIWYPAEILDAAAGFVYGFWVALALVMGGWILNGAVSYWIGRHAARPLLFRVFGRRRFLGYERLVARGGVSLLLAMRLIPIVPFSLFSYVAGSARVPIARFLWTTAVGYLPITALFVYLGTRLEHLSLSDPTLWAGAGVLILLLVLTHRVGRRLGGLRAESH